MIAQGILPPSEKPIFEPASLIAWVYDNVEKLAPARGRARDQNKYPPTSKERIDLHFDLHAAQKTGDFSGVSRGIPPSHKNRKTPQPLKIKGYEVFQW